MDVEATFAAPCDQPPNRPLGRAHHGGCCIYLSLRWGKGKGNVEVVLFVSAVQDNRFSSEHAGTGHHQAIIHLSTIKHRCDCVERHTTEVSRSSVLCALLWHAAAVERCRPVHSGLRDYWQISRVLLLCYVIVSCLVVHASSHST